jgi:hypothetical protein
MSGDHDIPLLEFAHAMRAEVESLYIHPCGATTIHPYISDLFEAAASNDAHEVKRLVELIRSKIEFERGCYEC